MAGEFSTLAVSVLGGIGTGIVGLIGLRLQHRYAANTNQITTTLQEIESLIDLCTETATKVWQKVGDPTSEDVAETICYLHEIGSFIRFITVRVPNSKIRLDNSLVNFRVAATGDNFDVTGRAPDFYRKLEIRSAASQLKISCREVDFDRRTLHIPFLS
tara:strand:+ start:6563 stop:7039 length:477 start_codon:yes stop_codon:yes gene_type:complete